MSSRKSDTCSITLGGSWDIVRKTQPVLETPGSLRFEQNTEKSKRLAGEDELLPTTHVAHGAGH